MKRYEKESFIKSFTLFFTTLLILNSIVFFFYFNEQKNALHVEIFNKIKIYNYNFENKNLRIDIVPLKKINELYTLHIQNNSIFAYFDIPNSKKNSIKIIYPFKKYIADIDKIKNRTISYYIFSSLILFILSIVYSLYSINPLKKALLLLDEFLKDIIHDLNTPVSSILLNLKILNTKHSQDAIKRIKFSTKKIGSLYGNLEATINNSPPHKEKLEIHNLINEKLEFYKYLYPDVIFASHISVDFIYTAPDYFGRIVDNLLSNACKYNKQNGKVSIYIDKNQMIVEDTGIGIKNTKKVFKRYYKENERGIGLGLNIVKKLCDRLHYKINIDSLLGIGTKIKVTF